MRRRTLEAYKAQLQAAGPLQELSIPASWTRARRAVAKVEFHLGELFPRVRFVVTNPTVCNRAVLRFYNKTWSWGTMDQGRQAGGRDDAPFLPPPAG